MKNSFTLVVFILLMSSVFAQTNTTDTAGKKTVVIPSTFPLQASRKLTITGYSQPRFQYFQDTAKDASFDIRRSRLALFGSMTDRIDYRVFVELAGSVPPQLLETIFSYKFNDKLKLSVGQMLVPLGNDIIASETKMESVNRAVLSEVLGARGQDVIGNQNARDIGFQVSGLFKLQQRDFLKYAAGVFNGAGINKFDNNSDKAIAGRVTISPVKNLWLGGSYYNGSSRWGSDLTVDKNRDRCAFEGEYTISKFIVRSEYMAGVDDTIHRNGYYVQLIHNSIAGKLQLSARYEYFNYNTDVTGSAIQVFTFCPSFLFGEHAKIQLGYDVIREVETEQKKNDVAEVQLQLAF